MTGRNGFDFSLCELAVEKSKETFICLVSVKPEHFAPEQKLDAYDMYLKNMNRLLRFIFVISVSGLPGRRWRIRKIKFPAGYPLGGKVDYRFIAIKYKRSRSMQPPPRLLSTESVRTKDVLADQLLTNWSGMLAIRILSGSLPRTATASTAMLAWEKTRKAHRLVLHWVQ